MLYAVQLKEGLNLADQFHFVCGNGSESKLTSLSYSLACLIEKLLSQALNFLL